MLLAQISDLHVRPAGERYKDAVDSNRMLADAVEHPEPARSAARPRADHRRPGRRRAGGRIRIAAARCWAASSCPISDAGQPRRPREAGRVLSGARLSPLPANGPKHYVIDQFPVRVIALDTTVPGDHHGEVDDAGLAWLATALEAARDAPTVVMMHHPPIACGIPYLDKYMCRRPERIEAVIGRFSQCRARAVRPCPSTHPAALGRHAAVLVSEHGDTNCTAPSS